jgi:AcrR family transcriptional regulator
MPRARSLTPSTIAGAALAFIEREGVAALSMRAVASELDMSVMSLYRYVEGREELEALVVNLVLETVDLDVGTCTSWMQKITELVTRARGAISGHPAVVPLLLIHRHSSEHSRQWGEAVLRVLSESGFTGQNRVIAFRALLSYFLGAVQVLHLGPLTGAGTVVLSELSREAYPHLAETAAIAREISPDTEFQCGLEVVMSGIVKLKSKHSPPKN